MKRQGDLLIIPIAGIPEAAARVGHRVLAEGEATGHRHELTGGEVAVDGKTLYFQVFKGMEVTLTHPEHADIVFVPGTYKVIRQREYEPGGWRHVAD